VKEVRGKVQKEKKGKKGEKLWRERGGEGSICWGWLRCVGFNFYGNRFVRGFEQTGSREKRN